MLTASSTTSMKLRNETPFEEKSKKLINTNTSTFHKTVQLTKNRPLLNEYQKKSVTEKRRIDKWGINELGKCYHHSTDSTDQIKQLNFDSLLYLGEAKCFVVDIQS